MKQCPFCAEDIHDAAIVCKHCGRDIITSPAAAGSRTETKKKRGLGFKLAIALLVLIGLGVIGNLISAPTPSKKRSLNVSAARSALGFVLTSRESSKLSHCRVTVLDQGDDEWTAEVQGTIDSYQTIRIDWDQFEMNGHQMPSYVGTNRKYFTINCILEDSLDGLSAGVSF